MRRLSWRYAALAILSFAVLVSGCGAHRDSVARLDGCSQASPVTDGFVRLEDFDVFGVSSHTTQVATDPLFPSYPGALLPQKFRLQARDRLRAPLRVTAFECRSGEAVRFDVENAQDRRPQPVSGFRVSGVRSIRLSWPPPLTAPDPPSWLVAPLFFQPGIGVVRFSRGHEVVEQLSLRICVPKPGPTADC